MIRVKCAWITFFKHLYQNRLFPSIIEGFSKTLPYICVTLLWSPLITMQRRTASPPSPETRCHPQAGWSGSSPWWWSLPSLCSVWSCCWLSWSTGGKIELDIVQHIGLRSSWAFTVWDTCMGKDQVSSSAFLNFSICLSHFFELWLSSERMHHLINIHDNMYYVE